jgi:nitrite reductase/ring-hydroxylating ferredoxin subunit
MAVSAAPVNDVVDRLENAGPLDPVVNAVRGLVSKALGPQKVRDALHGVWLGHPLHPVLTDVPIGMWGAAAVLDLMPGTGPAPAVLIASGVAAAVPTAATGWADWSQLHKPQQRVGVVHAVANIAGLGLYTASLAARMRGRTIRGKTLAFMGLGAVMAGGYLGGHLAFRQAAGVNHTSDLLDLFPSGWQGIGRLEELSDGELTKRTVAGIDLLVMRRGQHVDVLADKCTHLSGPLSEGTFKVEGGQGCVVCPWHGSTFRLNDGGVVHGPTTSPQPSFDVRVTGGTVEVQLPTG